jgi:hypothetical protein
VLVDFLFAFRERTYGLALVLQAALVGSCQEEVALRKFYCGNENGDARLHNYVSKCQFK